MTWLKTDDRYPEHRKIRRLSDGAYRLHHTAQCACAKDETDGLITEADLDDMQHIGRLRKYIPDLVAAGLWEVDPRGWLVHDYLDYNPSHLQLEAERFAARERQKKRRAKFTGTGSPQENHASDSQASPDHVADPDALPSQDNVSRRDSRVSHGPVTRESQPPVPFRTDPSRSDPTSNQQPAVVGARKRGTRLDPEFIPSDESRAKILAECPQVDLRREHSKFIDYWTDQPGAKGVRVSWNGTWCNWMRKAADDAPRNGANGTNGKSRRQTETDDLFTRNAVRMGVNPEQLSLEGRPA